MLLLISLYADHQEMFSNSAYKAFQVWKKIAEEMAAKGYRFTGLQCDKKFRSLKYRYVLLNVCIMKVPCVLSNLSLTSKLGKKTDDQQKAFIRCYKCKTVVLSESLCAT